MDTVGELVGQYAGLVPLAMQHAGPLLAAAAGDRGSYAFTKVPSDLSAMTAYIEAALVEKATGLGVPFAIVEAGRGTIVGSTRFLDLESWPVPGGPDPRTTPSTAEIGATWLAASVQRSAVNTECKLLMLTHAFEVWGTCRVSLKTDARNERSWAAIERIGGQFEGVRRAQALGADGTIRDTAYFSITASEWPAAKVALESRLAQPNPPAWR